MTFSRNNMLNGLCLAGVALILLSQAHSKEGVLVTEGIHPMDYPRFLLFMLLGLSVLVAVKPAKPGEDTGGIPIVSRRTVSMCLSFVLYALLFETAGFAVSAFLGMALCALIMGYRRYGMLCASCVISCVCVWLTFTYALKIQLPAGTIW